MSSFQQFLEDQAARVQSEKLKGLARREEWQEAVERLKARIKEWLAEEDPKRRLTISESPLVSLNEVGIGAYQVVGLTIWFELRQVRLEPVARNVAGSVASTGMIHIPRAFGRVDLTNGLNKYMIFRDAVEPEDHWRIIEQDRFEVRDFDRRSFVAALQDLLG